MLSHALRVIFILLEVVVLFNLLIVVHEIGHFLAARFAFGSVPGHSRETAAPLRAARRKQGAGASEVFLDSEDLVQRHSRIA